MLPPELIARIVSHVEPEDQLALELTCTAMKQQIDPLTAWWIHDRARLDLLNVHRKVENLMRKDNPKRHLGLLLCSRGYGHIQEHSNFPDSQRKPLRE